MMDIELDCYFRADMSEARRAAVLARWAEELQDWTVPLIREAVAKWIRSNPDKKPNYGHIPKLLKEAWGEKVAPEVRKAMAQHQHKPVAVPPVEQRQAIAAELADEFPGPYSSISQPKGRSMKFRSLNRQSARTSSICSLRPSHVAIRSPKDALIFNHSRAKQ